jgi:transcriptional regulator with XRE-family HTH domain
MPEKKPTGFGDRLRVLREAKDLTQRGLAEKAGCFWLTISKLERNLQEPTWPLVLSLCRVLGVRCTAFVPGRRGERAK